MLAKGNIQLGKLSSWLASLTTVVLMLVLFYFFHN